CGRRADGRRAGAGGGMRGRDDTIAGHAFDAAGTDADGTRGSRRARWPARAPRAHGGAQAATGGAPHRARGHAGSYHPRLRSGARLRHRGGTLRVHRLMGAQAVVGWMVCVAMLGGAVACHNLGPMTDPVTVSPVDFGLDGPGENVDDYAGMVDVR